MQNILELVKTNRYPGYLTTLSQLQMLHSSEHDGKMFTKGEQIKDLEAGLSQFQSIILAFIYRDLKKLPKKTLTRIADNLLNTRLGLHHCVTILSASCLGTEKKVLHK
jgi:hypothetical protein